MKKSMKNRMGVAFLLLGSLLLVAHPAVAQEPTDLQAAYDGYQAQQEHDAALAAIEADKEAFAQELAARFDLPEEVANTLGDMDAEALLELSQAASWEEYLGEVDTQLVFYPLTPCRIVDTRIASRWGYSPIPSGGTRSFDVYGNTSTQGGAIDCGVSSDAAGVVINVTAVPVVGGDGFLTVWPFGLGRPTASLVNYNGNSTANAVANAVVQTIRRLAADQLSVYAHRSSDVVVDVIGYFARPARSALAQSIRTASRTINALTTASVTASCLDGWTLTGGGCALSWSGSLFNITETRPSGTTGWYCEGWNGSINNRTLTAYAICNRTPGR